MIGRTLAHFRVTAKLGQGGMGEVYCAEDLRLGRQVALKLLPDAFAADPERLARFQREARALAAVQHSGIAQIHGLEEADGRQLLVLELVPGETLAERLERGALPLDEALAIAIRLAEALQAAHDRGIIHRDLKPANLKVSADGDVKVLDFGLAKAVTIDGGGAPPGDLTQSPTLAFDATVAGMLLGTAPYMSPEQARGKAVDARADVWAFGCILYEMLSGLPAFRGATVTDVLAAVVFQEPEWSDLPPGLPPRLLLVLRRCLAKDARRRLHHIADVRLELEAVRDEPLEPGAAVPGAGGEAAGARPRMTRRSIAMAAVAALLLLAVGAALARLWPRSPAEEPVRRLEVLSPAAPALVPDSRAPMLALSPDGSRLVYAGGGDGTSRLYLRAFDDFEARPLAGTEDAVGPFFSPDGEWVGFTAGGKLKKVSLASGSVVTLGAMGDTRGAAWGPNGIVLSQWPGEGLLRVGTEGGTPQPLPRGSGKPTEVSQRLPQVLPGGRHALFTALREPASKSSVDVVELATGERRELVENAIAGRFLPPRHLLFVRGGNLYALRFDPRELAVVGEPALILEGLDWDAIFGSAQFDVSSRGDLAYVPALRLRGNLARVENGQRLPLPPSGRPWLEMRLSPDGRRAALVDQIGGDANDVWIYDFATEGLFRLTSEGGYSPAWTADGREVTYRRQDGTIVARDADGAGEERTLLAAPGGVENFFQAPVAWSPDGRSLVLTRKPASTSWDLWIAAARPDGTLDPPRPFMVTAAEEGLVSFSPDGRWIAFESTATGRPEVYVQAFPGSGGRRQLSTAGGGLPVWTRTGEVLYVEGGRLLAVKVTTGPGIAVGPPRLVLDGLSARSITVEAFPDGTPLLLETVSDRPAVRLVLGFAGELRRRLGASGSTSAAPSAAAQ